jgi:exodeoxyribonuclease VII large subunit
MSPSEELRFDFEVVIEAAIPPKKRARRGTDEVSEDVVPGTDELLARIAKVQAVATKRAEPVAERTGALESDGASDGTVTRATNWHPSRGTHLTSLAAEIGISSTDAEIEVEFEQPDPLDDAEMSDGDSLSIAEFYARIRHALRSEFTEEVWVTGEIRSIRESRGHHYLELGDQMSDQSGKQSSQQLQVVCWSRDWPVVAQALNAAGVDLEVGRVVRVRGKVGVWEGASKLQFTLTALDVEALLGGIAAARRRLLLMLEAEGLLRANAAHPVPVVPLRIGVVTSPGTEAHQDFIGELERSGIAFELRLEATLVQGNDAPARIAAALERLADFEPDLAVVIRGGGARGDLSCFDAEAVARAIAIAPFPVWTGIGHTGDRSVADEVAGLAFITPTACGEAIVARVSAYWEEIERRISTAGSLARARLESERHGVISARQRLSTAARYQLERRGRDVELVASRLGIVAGETVERSRSRLTTANALLSRAGERAVASGETALERRAQVLRAFDPRRQLERGWSLTRLSSGRLLRSAADAGPDDVVITRLADGEITAVVTESTLRDEKGGAK